MLKPELYNKTVDILVQAYFNDTLEHGNCYACAVGNMIAANCGYEFVDFKRPLTGGNIHTGIGHLFWDKNNNFEDNPVGSLTHIGSQRLFGKQISQQFHDHVNSTGYTFDELCQIEDAFEEGNWENSKDLMFEGLLNVVSALDIIHQNNDTQVTQYSKSKFIKQTVL